MCVTPRADLEHLAHRGVAEDRRRDLAELAAPVDAVGRAERRGAGAQQHAAGRGIEVVDVLDHERLLELRRAARRALRSSGRRVQA